MKVHIIATGGTIEGLDYDRNEVKPNTVNASIKDFFENAKVSFEYTIDQAFNKDSRWITSEDRKWLSKKIELSKSDKVIITHGTITMVDTARYLGLLGFDKTIVLVGSFILGTEKNTDGPFNLGFAVGALQNLSHGVYIAMHGNIFTWDNVIKNVETNRFENKI